MSVTKTTKLAHFKAIFLCISFSTWQKMIFHSWVTWNYFNISEVLYSRIKKNKLRDKRRLKRRAWQVKNKTTDNITTKGFTREDADYSKSPILILNTQKWISNHAHHIHFFTRLSALSTQQQWWMKRIWCELRSRRMERGENHDLAEYICAVML